MIQTVQCNKSKAACYTSAKDLSVLLFPPDVFTELFWQICAADVATEFVETRKLIKQMLVNRISKRINVGLLSGTDGLTDCSMATQCAGALLKQYINVVIRLKKMHSSYLPLQQILVL